MASHSMLMDSDPTAKESLKQAISNSEGVAILGRILASCNGVVSVTTTDLREKRKTLDEIYEQIRSGEAEFLSGEGDHKRPDLANDYVAPETDEERQLCVIWQKFLGFDGVGVTDNFFELGGHSLLAVKILANLKGELGSDLPMASFLNAPTIREQAQIIGKISSEATSTVAAIEIISEQERYHQMPLSYAQQRMWFIDQISTDSTHYNMAFTLKMVGKLDAEKVRLTFEEISRRHESVRTVFPSKDGEGRQWVKPLSPWPLAVHGMDEKATDQQVKEAVQKLYVHPFDLVNGPLFITTLISRGDKDHYLTIVMHHIISDGWSLGVIVREFSAIYPSLLNNQSIKLPELPIQYLDYSLWQRNLLQGSVLEQHINYWQDQLHAVEPLILPLDHSPLVASFEGDSYQTQLSATLCKKLTALSRANKVTLYMTLLAAYKLLLSRFSGQEDICLGTFVANRDRAELEGLIGYFANTLPLRCSLAGDPTFSELLQRVNQVTKGAYSHQELPFEKIVDEVSGSTSDDRQLINAVFVLQNAQESDDVALSLPDLNVSLYRDIEATRVRFYVEVHMSEVNEHMVCQVIYRSDLFDRETIVSLMDSYTTILEQVCITPDQPMSKYSLSHESQSESTQFDELDIDTMSEEELDKMLRQLSND